MTQRMLITGTAGFIFSNFLRIAVYQKAPYEIFSLDKIANSSMMNNIFQKKIAEFQIADICDEHIMDRIFEYIEPEIIIHGAAESNVDKSINNPNVFTKSNIVGTQNLINLAVKYKTKLFVYQSTDEVYGSLAEDESPWIENSPMDPRNPYSASKAAGEMLLKAAHNTYGLNYLIVRSCNNMGPRQDHSKLIPRVIKCIREKKKIPIYGDGLQSRDWIHTHDNAQAILYLLDKKIKNDIFNISANQEKKNIEVINAICDIMGEGKNLLEKVEDRAGHDRRYALNADKIKALGWNPVYKNFSDAVKNTINWYQSNPYYLKD